jgi:hypothetical protein
VLGLEGPVPEQRVIGAECHRIKINDSKAG